MPIYYVHKVRVTEEDVARSRASWNIILHGSSPTYLEILLSNPKLDPHVWFSNIYYSRLFDVDPYSKESFNFDEYRLKVELFDLINTMQQQKVDPEGFSSKIQNYAVALSKREVKSSQISVMGDVLFWSLENALGALFGEESKFSWVKLFSRLLDVMIPPMIEYERRAVKTKKDSPTPIIRMSGPAPSFRDIS